MRTIGASLGAQIAATTVSSIPLEHGFTVALAIAAAGAAAGLLPTLLLASPGQASSSDACGGHALTRSRAASRCGRARAPPARGRSPTLWFPRSAGRSTG